MRPGLRGRLRLFGVGVLATLLLPASEAIRRSPWRGEDYWTRRYRKICEWDSRCLNLHPGEDWAKPSAIITQVLQTLNPTLQSVARLYRIDARALVGVLLAENSMNVTPFDQLQNILASSQILPTGKFLGHAFTLGLGQINEPAASKVENLAAQLEARPKRSSERITQLLLTPGGALCYAAAILRDAQDAYEEVGIAVGGRPGVLATLYNLGYPREHAAERLQKGGQPQVNAFGLFVEMNLTAIEGILQPVRTLPVGTPCPRDP